MRRFRKLISMTVMMAMLATVIPYQALAAEPAAEDVVTETSAEAETQVAVEEELTQEDEAVPEGEKEEEEAEAEEEAEPAEEEADDASAGVSGSEAAAVAGTGSNTEYAEEAEEAGTDESAEPAPEAVAEDAEAAGTTEAAAVEEEKKVELSEGSVSASAGGFTVRAEGMLPKGAELVLTKLSDGTVEEVGEGLGKEDQTAVFAYDITIKDEEGKVWQPEELGVKISISGLDLENKVEVSVAHVLDKEEAVDAAVSNDAVSTEEVSLSSGAASELETAVEAAGNDGSVVVTTITEDDGLDVSTDEVSFGVDSFSAFIVFTVDFEYEEYTYSITGESSILLSELFAALKIEQEMSEITSVEWEAREGYDPNELVSIEKKDGDYLLTSLKAFDTEETLIIKTPTKEYKIKVTDDDWDTTGDWDGTGTYSGVKYRWSIKWDTVGDGTNFTYEDDGTLFAHPATQSQIKVAARITTDVNAVVEGATIPAGMVKFTLPAHFFNAWNDEIVDTFVGPEDLTTSPDTAAGNFYYTVDEENNTVTVINCKPIGGTDYFSTVVKWQVDPLNINGGHPDDSNPGTNWWDNYIDPYTDSFNTNFVFDDQETGTKELKLKMATRASTTASAFVMNDTAKGIYLNWQDNWGTKPADADDHFYIVWNVTQTRNGLNTTQPYDYSVLFNPSENAFTIGDETFTPELVGIRKSTEGGNVTSYVTTAHSDHSYNNIATSMYNTGRQATSMYTTLPYGDDDADDYPNTNLDYGKATGYVTFSAINTNYGGDKNIYMAVNTFFAVLLSYPWEALEKAEEEGIDLANDGLSIDAVFHTDTVWDSGYHVDKELPTRPAVVYLKDAGPGNFYKETRAGLSFSVMGGQSSLVNDIDLTDKDGWNIVYKGGQPVTSGDQIVGRDVIITDEDMSLYMTGNSGDQVALTEDEYSISGVQFLVMDEYDADYSHDTWSVKSVASTDYDNYEPVYIYTRARGETDYVPYMALVVVGSNKTDIYEASLGSDGKPVLGDKLKSNQTLGYNFTLPDDTVGFKVLHHSDFFKTDLTVRLFNVSLYAKDRIKEVIAEHIAAGKTSNWVNTAGLSIKNDNGTEEDEETSSARRDFGAINPVMQAIKTTYTLPETDSRQIEAGIEKKQLAYVMLSGVVATYGNSTLLRKYGIYNGTFYELLPKGVTVKENSFKMTYDGSLTLMPTAQKYAEGYVRGSDIPADHYTVRTEIDEATGQTMLIVNYEVPENYNPSSSGHIIVHCGFVLVNTIDNINTYGTLTPNAVGFVDESTPEGMKVNTGSQFETMRSTFGERAAAFEEIAETYKSETSNWAAFTQTNITWNNPKTIEAGFSKEVKANNTKNGLSSNASYQKEDEVQVGNTYTYKLNFSTQPGSAAKNIVFYDILETGTDDDTKVSDWTGTFKSLDLSAITAKVTEGGTAKCAPVVYYSTTLEDRNSLSGDYFDLTDTSVWSTTAPADLSSVTAIAIDCTYADDGEAFVLGEQQAISAFIVMNTPDEYTPNLENYALNGAVVKATGATSGGTDRATTSSSVDDTTLISDAKVKLLPVGLTIEKTSDPESGTAENPTIVEAFGDGTIDYTLKVRNSSDYDYDDVVVEDDIPAGLTIGDITIKLNGADEKPIDEVSGVTYTLTGQHLTVTIKQQHPTVLDDEGAVTTDKDTYIIIPTTVDTLKGATVDVRLYDNQAEITSFNGEEPEEPIESEVTHHKAHVGNLKVSNEVYLNDEAQSGVPFTYTVTLTNADGTPMANASFTDGSVTVTTDADGKATFTLNHGENFTFKDLPVDAGYTVVETTKAGYAITTPTNGSDTYTGTIEGNTTKQAPYVNKKYIGDLEISNEVYLNGNAKTDVTYTYTVTLTKDGTPLANTTFTDGSVTVTTDASGVATVTLNHDESFTFKDILAGTTYTVVETAVAGYEITTPTSGSDTYTGSIVAKETQEAPYVNERNIGDLKISNEVYLNDEAQSDVPFTYTVTLKDKNNNPIANTTFTDGDVTVTTDENGVATVTLEHGGDFTFKDLPAEATYSVVETTIDGYAVTMGADNYSGTIVRATVHEAPYVNERNIGDLKISNEVYLNDEPEDDVPFTYTVTLTDENGDPIADTEFTDPESGVTVKTDENGVATITLENGESFTFPDLPEGTQYSVVETTVDGYAVTTGADDYSGTIERATVHEAPYVNKKSIGDLIISNEVYLNDEKEEGVEFTYTVELKDKDGNPVTGTFTDEATGKTITFDETGKGTVVLAHGESITIKGLPAGTEYKVTQTDRNGYTVTVGADDYSGTISQADTMSAPYVNKRYTGSVVISNEVYSNDEPEPDKPFSFTVEITDPDGNPIPNTEFTDPETGKTVKTDENGIVTIILNHGESFTLEGIPEGSTVKVVEVRIDGYTVTTGADDYTLTVAGMKTVEAPYVNKRYEDVETSVIISGVKVLKGKDLKAEQFTFVLTDESGKKVLEALNDAEGKFEFGAITYALSDLGEETEKVFTYGIAEANDEQKNITYDKTVYTVKVTVKKGKDGTLTATADKNGEEIKFTNTYNPPSNPPKNPPSNNTGDSANGALWALLLLLAGGALAGTIWYRRKKKV